MDCYQTAATAVHHIIKVAIFIKGVISDVKQYDDDRAKIQLKIDLQLVSLEFFRRKFLDEKNGLMLPGKLPEWVSERICDLLLRMKRVLAEYRELVDKYIAFDEKSKTIMEKGDEWKESLFNRAKTQAKTLKIKGYDWSLFDKKKLLSTLEEFQGWSSDLKDIMQHFSQEAVDRLERSRPSLISDDNLEGTGLEQVVQRQKLVLSHPPPEFKELDGDILEKAPSSNRFQPATWVHANNSTPVLVEYREYDARLRLDDLDPEEIAELKAPVRNLAWLLQKCTFEDGENEGTAAQQPVIYSLQCLGFIDQISKERTAFLYKFPSSLPANTVPDTDIKIVTLHELITKTEMKTNLHLKPSLTDRFNIAHSLALTVSNVHASLWLHKNIWSHGILLFQRNKEGISSVTMLQVAPGDNVAEKSRIVAFLEDWGYARPIEGATSMRKDFEVEPNIYRHPERQGAPTRQFAQIHDIYALGVVLMEIGLWKTMSHIFEVRLKEAKQTGKFPKNLRNALVALARSRLPQEMGDVYSEAVVRCLTTDFRKSSDMELSIDFRGKVVDAIAGGRKL